MKKVFVIMIAAVLLLGVTGCADSQVSGTKASSTPDAKVSATPDAEVSQSEGISVEQEAMNEYNEANANTIAISVNTYNALNPDNMLPDNATLAEVKEALKEKKIWPSYLSDDDAEKAWGLIEIKNGEAKVKE